MIEKELLLIPIYRCSPEDHELEIQKARQKYLDSFETNSQDFLNTMSNIFDKEKWYPWKFNEAIGWIEIIFHYSKVKGEMWLVNKRINKNLRKKLYFYRRKVFEITLSNSKSNQEISENLINDLTEQWKETQLSKKDTLIGMISNLKLSVSIGFVLCHHLTMFWASRHLQCRLIFVKTHNNQKI